MKLSYRISAYRHISRTKSWTWKFKTILKILELSHSWPEGGVSLTTSYSGCFNSYFHVLPELKRIFFFQKKGLAGFWDTDKIWAVNTFGTVKTQINTTFHCCRSKQKSYMSWKLHTDQNYFFESKKKSDLFFFGTPYLFQILRIF